MMNKDLCLRFTVDRTQYNGRTDFIVDCLSSLKKEATQRLYYVLAVPFGVIIATRNSGMYCTCTQPTDHV